MNKPALLVVDDDPQVRSALRRDMRDKYRDQYTVLAAGSGEEALSTVNELKARGDALALVLSDERMPGMAGHALLAATRDIFPIAGRVLLTAYSDIDAAIKAINDAHVHHYLAKPWAPPEEHLFPVLDDLLENWLAERPPNEAGLRLVGHQWSPRSHGIKDFLASNLVPYSWRDVDRDVEARTLLQAADVGDHELPALFFEDGSVLRNPEPAQVAERLGRATAAAYPLYDLAIVGAGPAGLAAAVYGASEGLRTLLVDRHAPGARPGPAPRSGVPGAARGDRRDVRGRRGAPVSLERAGHRHAGAAGGHRHGLS